MSTNGKTDSERRRPETKKQTYSKRDIECMYTGASPINTHYCSAVRPFENIRKGRAQMERAILY